MSAPQILAGLIFLVIDANLVFCQNSQAQEIDTLMKQADNLRFRDFSKSDSLYDIAAQMILDLGSDSKTGLAIRLWHQRAIGALFHNKFTLTKKFLDVARSSITDAAVTLGQKADSLKAQTQVLEAKYFYALGDYNSALETLDTAENYFEAQKPTASVCNSLYQILQFQASIYYLQGEFESCIDRYLASIEFYNCYSYNEPFRTYILVHRNIGQAYSKVGDFEKARSHFFAAKANLDTCPNQFKTFIIRNHALILYNSMAEFYRAQNKIDSARYFFMEGRQFLDDNPTYASRINDGLAKVALAEKDYKTALVLFTQSLQQMIQARGEKHYLTASLYRSISSVYQEMGNYQKAILFIQKALSSLSPSANIDPDNYNANPSLSVLYTPKEMVMTLHYKATLLCSFFQHTCKPDVLVAAHRVNIMALKLLDSTRNEFSLEKDKVVLGEDAVKVYQTGLTIATLLYHSTNDQSYLFECFELIDKSKSAVLMDHIKLIKNFGGIPSKLVDRERELKVELSAAEQQLYTAEIKKEETSTYRQHLGEIKKAYAKLLSDIKVSAPNYYKLRIENKQLTLTEAQGMLQPEELLVEYFFSDSTLYAMAVTPTTAELHTLAIDSLRSQVETLRNMLARPGNLTDATYQAKWNSICNAVFKKVVTPWEKYLESSKRIIVVPHDVLNYLPLEMLSDSGTPLVKSVSISYASSAALLREQKQMTSAGNFFAAFNADYSNQPHLPQLAGAAREVSSIESIFGFRSSRFASATADDFRKEAGHYKIIHLALHSLINDEKPMFSRLVFTRTNNEANSDITANELYSMELNAEIAVLSACETGLGKLHRGEGMMSLSRAFMYAGVPSTVISLWKVPDQSASILMTKFYQFLKNGHRKDDALQLAKLDMISEHPEMSHPFFWAGFIINGKTDPVTFTYFSKREFFAIGTICVLLLIATAIFIWKKKRDSKSIAAMH